MLIFFIIQIITRAKVRTKQEVHTTYNIMHGLVLLMVHQHTEELIIL